MVPGLTSSPWPQPVCITQVSPDRLVKFLDLTGALTTVRARQVLAINDVEAIRPPIFDGLIEAISNFQVSLMIGAGAGARKHMIPLPKFTFVGTTSKPWLVDDRLRRWCIPCQFASYTLEEAAQIVMRIAQEKSILLDLDAAFDVAAQFRLRPGEVATFLQRVASHSPFGPSDQIDRSRLRQLNEFLGSGNIYPDMLTVADQLRTMDGTEFEHWVGELFRRAGFRVEITQPSGDHGVDLWVSTEGCLIAVQCKRWDGSVGEPVVRDLYGAMMAGKAQWGCVVTTGSFTGQAELFSADKPLYLMALDSLMEAAKSPEVLARMLKAP